MATISIADISKFQVDNNLRSHHSLPYQNKLFLVPTRGSSKEAVMKKLITYTFAITALLIGSLAIQAQPLKKQKVKFAKSKKYSNTVYNNGSYSKRGVYTYYQTKYKWHYGKKYINTYKIKVYPNGRKNVKLVKSVQAKKHFGGNTHYTTQIVRQGWKLYRVTYKVTKYRGGLVSKTIVKKQRIQRYG